MSAASRLLVTCDHLVTLGEPAVLADGAVIVEGSEITETGPRELLEGHGPFDAVLGGPGFMVLPGFVNTHYHTECWTARGLIGTIFEYTNLFIGAGAPAADEEALELLATWGLVLAARGGQTTMVDVFYGKPGMPLLGAEPVLRAYERTGLRTAFALTLRDQNIYAHESDDRFLARLPDDIAARRHWHLQHALAVLQLGRPVEARRVLDALAGLGPIPSALAPLWHWRRVLLALAERDPAAAPALHAARVTRGATSDDFNQAIR